MNNADIAKRLREMAHGVQLYGAPDKALLARRIEAVADDIEPTDIADEPTGYAGPIEPGMQFVWERDKPHARCTVTVTKVVERQFRDRQIWAYDDRFCKPPREVWNDESRFREAVTPI